MKALSAAGRLGVSGSTLRYKRFVDDFPVKDVSNLWTDTSTGSFTESKVYVVQTSTKVIERCLLMTTDPGDLVLDPTCFRAGTLVKAEAGWRAIESTRAGERVWTHAGRLRRVLGRQARPHLGAMLGLRLEGSETVVWCTPDHRFLVASQPHPRSPSPSDGEGAGGEDRRSAPPHPTPVPPPHPMGRGPGGEVRSAALPTNSKVHRGLGGLNPALVKLARELRQNSTEVEDQLWQCLRARRFNGLKFRRQHPLGPHYIPDFYCAETKVSVELDGEVHNSRRAQWADGIRHRQIQEAGVRVVRFENERVKGDLVGVLEEIAAVCESQMKLLNGVAHEPHPLAPSPSDGEGEQRRGVEGGLSSSPPSPPLHQMERGLGGEVAWRQACNLRVGDFIVADDTGPTKRLASVERILTEETVYDLTIEDDHSFITEAGVAHNCGSGTTAYVAEQWGRRWITMDTSRVPLALARQRLLTATFPYYELKEEERGPAGGFVYKRKQNKKGEEVGGIVPHVTLKSIANNEPPAEEVLVDRPEVNNSIVRVSGPFAFEATIPTPVDWEGDGVEDSGAASSEDYGSFVDRMLEVLRRSPVLRLEGNRSVQLKNIRPPAKSLSLSAEAVVEQASAPASSPVAIVFGPENGAVSEKLVYEAAREAHAKNYTHLYVIGFAIQPNARALVEKCHEVMGVPATYVQATPDLMMGDLLKNMRSSQIFSVCGLPEVKVSKVPPTLGSSGAARQSPKLKVSHAPKAETQYQVELLGLDVFDPISMEVDHQSGHDVPAWFLDTDYNGLCFHVSQAFFPRTGAWENLKKALKGDYEESVWDHLAGAVSAPFPAGEHGQIAVKVIDQRGNELLVVKPLKEL